MKLIIPGIPIPQGRMRHSTFRGFTQTYDPNAKQKKEIRKIISFSNVLADYKYPRISFLFHMPIPKGIRKKDEKLYNSGLLKHDKKPDVDNLIKLYLDCMDGIVFNRDQKVSLGPSIKLYHPIPKTVIWIIPTKETISPLELDYAFLDVSEYEIQSFSL